MIRNKIEWLIICVGLDQMTSYIFTYPVQTQREGLAMAM